MLCTKWGTASFMTDYRADSSDFERTGRCRAECCYAAEKVPATGIGVGQAVILWQTAVLQQRKGGIRYVNST